ncbi:MAG: hypothetical protein ABI024_03960 [Vicinamibacterales bacterium]
MLNLLISLLVFALVAGLIFYLIGQIPLPAPWSMVVRVLAVVICIVLLLSMLGGVSVPWGGRLR